MTTDPIRVGNVIRFRGSEWKVSWAGMTAFGKQKVKLRPVSNPNATDMWVLRSALESALESTASAASVPTRRELFDAPARREIVEDPRVSEPLDDDRVEMTITLPRVLATAIRERATRVQCTPNALIATSILDFLARRAIRSEG